ncbi:MAG TPA: hypothetical protein VMZ69_11845, partial [Saprospiraceae bacterium]|nr:hypothetical protein [Saprospiraceae bacterium]
DYFSKKGFNNIFVSGDTRVDRSLALPSEVSSRMPKEIMNVAPFDLIAGSTWPRDEELLIYAIKKLNLKAIIAPHDVSLANIQRLTKELPFPFQLYSQLGKSTIDFDVLVIDTIGLLSVMYSAGSISYVGGGFGKGIHNILEPTAHAKPVIFGPRYQKFHEAEAMIRRHCAWSVNHKNELLIILKKLLSNNEATASGKIAYQYLKEKAGASDTVTNYILESIPYSSKV